MNMRGICFGGGGEREGERGNKEWDIIVHGSLTLCIIYVYMHMQIQALIALEDAIHPDSRTAIRELEGMGLSVHLLTGDSLSAGKALAETIGIPLENVKV